jgi:hypothetical protein
VGEDKKGRETMRVGENETKSDAVTDGQRERHAPTHRE